MKPHLPMAFACALLAAHAYCQVAASTPADRLRYLADGLERVWADKRPVVTDRRFWPAAEALAEVDEAELRGLLKKEGRTFLETRLVEIALARRAHPKAFREVHHPRPTPRTLPGTVHTPEAELPARELLTPTHRLAWEERLLSSMISGWPNRVRAETATQALAAIGDVRSLALLEWALVRLFRLGSNHRGLAGRLVYAISLRGKAPFRERALESVFAVHQKMSDEAARRPVFRSCLWMRPADIATSRRRAAPGSPFAAFLSELDRTLVACALAKRVYSVGHKLRMSWSGTDRDGEGPFFDLHAATAELAKVDEGALREMLKLSKPWPRETWLTEVALARQAHPEPFAALARYRSRTGSAKPSSTDADGAPPAARHTTLEHRLAWEEMLMACRGREASGVTAMAALATIGDPRSLFVVRWALHRLLHEAPGMRPFADRVVLALGRHCRGGLRSRVLRTIYDDLAEAPFRLWPAKCQEHLLSLLAEFPAELIEAERRKRATDAEYARFLEDVAKRQAPARTK